MNERMATWGKVAMLLVIIMAAVMVIIPPIATEGTVRSGFGLDAETKLTGQVKFRGFVPLWQARGEIIHLQLLTVELIIAGALMFFVYQASKKD